LVLLHSVKNMVAIAVHFLSTSPLPVDAQSGSCETIVSFIQQKILLPTSDVYSSVSTVYVSLGGRLTPQYTTTRTWSSKDARKQRQIIYFHFFATPWEDQLCNEAAFVEVWCPHVVFRHGHLFHLLYIDAPTNPSSSMTQHDMELGTVIDRLQMHGLYRHRTLTSRIGFVYLGSFPPWSSSTPSWTVLKRTY
jgi:hypothetical protein